MTSWPMFAPGPVMTDNAVTKMHRLEWARRTRGIREEWGWIARAARVPRLAAARIAVQPHQKRGRLADVAACSLHVKAAVDGLVDVDILEDDGPDILWEIRFLAPVRMPQEGLALTIEGPLRV